MPINGTELDPNVTANVAGTKVAFCCSKCLKQVSDTPEMADRAELVFGDKAFEKSFVKVTAQPVAGDTPKIDLTKAHCLIEPKRKASAEYSVDHLEGKVFFCCEKCADQFRDSPEKHAVAANHQLAVTGQYVQTECPLVGGPVSSENSGVVGGVNVGLCCEKCEAAIDAAKSDEQKLELVFNPDRFARSFQLASTASVTAPETQSSQKPADSQ